MITGNGDLRVSTHHVIIRHIRHRSTQASAGIMIRSWNDAHDIIIDHCSLGGSYDDTMDIFWNDANLDPLPPNVRKVTVQKCIIAESMKRHPTGMVIAGKPELGGAKRIDHISVHDNYFVHNGWRNPHVKSRHTEIINNVAYNWGHRVGVASGESGEADWINNYWKRGPMSGGRVLLLQHLDGSCKEENPIESVYLKGNIVPSRNLDDPNSDNWFLIETNERACGDVSNPVPTKYRRFTPLEESAPVPVTVQTSSLSMANSLLNDVGANVSLNADGTFTNNQDSADKKFINDFHNGTGPNDEPPSPTFPTIRFTTRPSSYDQDRDGMSDSWERTHFKTTSRGSSSDSSSDFDGDGYTDLEEFLNGTDPLTAFVGAPPTSTKPTGSGITKPVFSLLPDPSPTSTPTSACPSPNSCENVSDCATGGVQVPGFSCTSGVCCLIDKTAQEICPTGLIAQGCGPVCDCGYGNMCCTDPAGNIPDSCILYPSCLPPPSDPPPIPRSGDPDCGIVCGAGACDFDQIQCQDPAGSWCQDNQECAKGNPLAVAPQGTPPPSPIGAEEGGLVPCGRADDDKSTPIDEREPCGLCHLFLLSKNVSNWLTLTIIPILAVLLAVFGGFILLTSRGNPQQATKGKSILIWAVAGYAIIFVGWIVLNSFFAGIGVMKWTGIQGETITIQKVSGNLIWTSLDDLDTQDLGSIVLEIVASSNPDLIGERRVIKRIWDEFEDGPNTTSDCPDTPGDGTGTPSATDTHDCIETQSGWPNGVPQEGDKLKIGGWWQFTCGVQE